MKSFVGLMLLAAVLFACGTVFGAQVSIGITIGPPPPPPPEVHVLPPPSPGPEFVWVEGYWYPVKKKYKWHPGYWTQAPYPGAHWVVPHYERGEFFEGYWDGGRGRWEHDHRWDDDPDRDFHKGKPKGKFKEKKDKEYGERD
jgi:hypothetical protein